MPLSDYQTEFLQLALKHEVLKFGEFTLKSGRKSPYFFNLGKISSGMAMRTLGAAYAQALAASGIEYDMLFGPAYKGIPLVTAVACAQAEQRSEEHTSELQSLMRISYAVFCLKKKNHIHIQNTSHI